MRQWIYFIPWDSVLNIFPWDGFELFLPGEGAFIFFKIYFFLEKDLLTCFILYFPRPAPQIVNGRPLMYTPPFCKGYVHYTKCIII